MRRARATDIMERSQEETMNIAKQILVSVTPCHHVRWNETGCFVHLVRKPQKRCSQKAQGDSYIRVEQLEIYLMVHHAALFQ